MQDTPDSGRIGGGKAVTQIMGNAFGTLTRLGVACGEHGRTVLLGYHLPPMVVGCRRAVHGIGAPNPALDGSAMNPKATRQFRLRHASGIQLLDVCALAASQRRVCVIVHHHSCSNG